MPDISFDALTFDMDIAVQFKDWTEQLSDIEAVVNNAVNQILSKLESPKLGELSIALVSDADIQTLNRDCLLYTSPSPRD